MADAQSEESTTSTLGPTHHRPQEWGPVLGRVKGALASLGDFVALDPACAPGHGLSAGDGGTVGLGWSGWGSWAEALSRCDRAFSGGQLALRQARRSRLRPQSSSGRLWAALIVKDGSSPAGGGFRSGTRLT